MAEKIGTHHLSTIEKEKYTEINELGIENLSPIRIKLAETANDCFSRNEYA